MLMLKARRTVWCILGMIFVFSITTAFAQQEQQSDSEFSKSQFIRIIDRIDKVEDNLRDYVDTKFKELDERIDTLDTKIDDLDNRFDKLSEDVAFIKGQLTIIKWGIAIFGAPLLIGMIMFFLQNREKKGQATTEITTKIASENRYESNVDMIRKNLRDKEPSESEVI